MEKMLDVYNDNYALYKDFAAQIQHFVTAYLQEKNIRVHAIVSRVKTAASLKQKIVTHEKYTQLKDITDLCGLRIITYFEDDVDQIGALIEEILAIDAENSIDKRKLLSPNQFGYLSLHFVASLPSASLQNPIYAKFKNCKIEIQVCSILQHAWAEIEHDLGYKSSTTLSYSTRRRFSRLAGLLEIADGEFKHLRNELEPMLAAVPRQSPELINEALTEVSPARRSEKRSWIKNKAAQLVNYMNGYLPQSTMAEYPLFCTLLLFLAIYCIADASHLLSPFLLAVKAEKHTIFALASSHIHV